jgi:hypothetical protein
MAADSLEEPGEAERQRGRLRDTTLRPPPQSVTTPSPRRSVAHMHLSASTGGGREGGRGSESRRATGAGGGGGGGGVNEESVARSASRRLDIDSYRSILLDDTLERGAAGIF